jgi:multidrug resistance efflux pump
MVTQLTVIAATVLAIVGSYLIATMNERENATFRLIGGAFIVVFWGAIAFWWTNYEIQKQLCCVVYKSNDVMSIVSVLAGLVMLLDVVMSAFGLIGQGAPAE